MLRSRGKETTMLQRVVVICGNLAAARNKITGAFWGLPAPVKWLSLRGDNVREGYACCWHIFSPFLRNVGLVCICIWSQFVYVAGTAFERQTFDHWCLQWHGTIHPSTWWNRRSCSSLYTVQTGTVALPLLAWWHLLCRQTERLIVCSWDMVVLQGVLYSVRKHGTVSLTFRNFCFRDRSMLLLYSHSFHTAVAISPEDSGGLPQRSECLSPGAVLSWSVVQ